MISFPPGGERLHSARLLVGDADYAEFVRRRRYSKDSIRAFAERIGVSPGIIVGRLQHEERLPFSHCNGLKVKLEWTASD